MRDYRANRTFVAHDFEAAFAVAGASWYF